MSRTRVSNRPPFAVIQAKDIAALITVLRADSTLIGPVIRSGAIVYEPVKSIHDLPAGWTDEQKNGSYRLKQHSGNAFFRYTVGPQSWKKYLFPPSLRLWRAQRKGSEFHYVQEPEETQNYAFLGVRACELQALAAQDQVFLKNPYADSYYVRHRERLLIIAVNCTRAGGTCFCASMDSGPRARSGFDLAMTEIENANHHYFVVETGTERGKKILEKIPHQEATEAEVEEAARAVDQAGKNMGRTLETEGLQDLLYHNFEHPRWDESASRCQTCANCSMVCPTCFCSNIEDFTRLNGQEAERVRLWDSCYNVDFSYIHGESVRASSKSRYRHWVMHKLATWTDQFGMMGCVGCGRCITWCPMGIDLTEEIQAIRQTEISRR